MNIRYPVVIDTNVLVSALITPNENAPTLQILNLLSKDTIIPVFSKEILEEYEEVLKRPKFCLDDLLIKAVICDIQDNGIEIKDIPEVKEQMIDPDDIIFYAVAISTEIENTFLVTGNKKHFPTKPFIVSPTELVHHINYFTKTR